MPRSYSRDFKKRVVELIKIENHSTIKTAEQFNIPLKTLEKWITAYNKNNHCFDPDYISPEKQIALLEKQLRKEKQTNEILKKAIALLDEKNQ